MLTLRTLGDNPSESIAKSQMVKLSGRKQKLLWSRDQTCDSFESLKEQN